MTRSKTLNSNDKTIRAKAKAKKMGILLDPATAKLMTQIEIYYHYQNSGLNKTESKLLAGYAPGTSTSQIEKSKSIRVIAETVEEQRDKLKRDSRFSLSGAAERVYNIATDKKTPAHVKLNAEKIIISDITGQKAAEHVQHTHLGLIAQLSDISNSDLDIINKEIQTNYTVESDS